MNNTFRQYAIEIIQSSDSDSVAKIKEAMEVYIATLVEDGLPVPTEAGRDTVDLEVAAG